MSELVNIYKRNILGRKKLVIKDYPITDRYLVDIPKDNNSTDKYVVNIGITEYVDIDIYHDYAIMINDTGMEVSEPISDIGIVDICGLVKTYYSALAEYYADFVNGLIGQTMN